MKLYIFCIIKTLLKQKNTNILLFINYFYYLLNRLKIIKKY